MEEAKYDLVSVWKTYFFAACDRESYPNQNLYSLFNKKKRFLLIDPHEDYFLSLRELQIDLY